MEELRFFRGRELPEGWEGFLGQPEVQRELKDIDARLEESGGYFPADADTMAPLYAVKPKRIRVFVLGQDPYYGRDGRGRPIATGIPFAIREGEALTSSLKNIYADLEATVPDFKPPRHGNLTKLLDQGVFFFNSRLTVPSDKKEKAHGFWSGFVAQLIEYVQKVRPRVVFVLWGAEAKKMTTFLRDSVVSFDCCHPSGRNGRAFVGEGTLQAVNNLFEERGAKLIDWQI